MENEARVREWKIAPDTVALLFSSHAWGISRKGNLKKLLNARQAVESPEEYEKVLGLTNKILVSPEHDAIRKYMANEVKVRYLSKRSVPSFFREGCYIFRLTSVERTEQWLQDAQKEVRRLVEEFKAVYLQQKEEARFILEKDGQYKEEDYPTVEELDNLFYLEWQWVSFRVPEDLPEQVRIAELAKAENMWRNAAENITYALRESFKKLIDHAADKLQVGSDGKKKKFQQSTIDNIREFLATFNDRNITSDYELEKLVKKAETVLGEVSDVKELKGDMQMREYVKVEFDGITKELDELMVSRPVRKFNFEE
jgi:hypothetical protein